MSEPTAPKKNSYAVFWPVITDEASAIKAAQNGASIAALCAVVTAVLAIGGWMGAEILNLVDAVIFAAVSFGIYKMSRFAAVAGLSIYLMERIFAWIQPGAHPNFVMAIMYTLFFISGIRGTFAYHRFKKIQPQAAPHADA